MIEAGNRRSLTGRAAVAVLVLWLAAALTAPALAEQSPDNAPAGRTWTTDLDSLDAEIANPEIPIPDLRRAHREARGILATGRQAALEATAEVARVEGLLAALGTPPEEGAAPESADVALERRWLNGEASAARDAQSQADLAVARAEEILGRITAARRSRAWDLLAAPGASLYAATTWSRAVVDFLRLESRLLASPAAWQASPEIRDRVGGGYYAAMAGAALFAILLGVWLRRRLLTRYGRTREELAPGFARRVTAAVAEGIARGLLPTLVVVALWLTLEIGGVLFGLFGDAVLVLMLTIGALALLHGIAWAALAPFTPEWRCVETDGRSALRIWQRLVGLAAILAVAALLDVPAAASPGDYPELAAVFATVVDSAVALALVLLLVPALWRPAPAGDAGRTGEEARRPRRLGPLLRGLALLAALAVPAIHLFNLHELATWLTLRLLGSGLVVTLAMATAGTLRDLTRVAAAAEGGLARRMGRALGISGEADSFRRFWILLTLNILLFLVSVYLLMLLWGAEPADMEVAAVRFLDGFSIGTVTIAPADLLLALVLFVILLLLVRAAQRFLENSLLPRTRLDVGARDALKAGVGYTGIGFAALIALSTSGIDLSTIGLIFGALSVGIGFGLQGIANNFVSGLILLLERPVKAGDWVVVGGHEGYVRRISVRATEIETFQRASVIIPNSEFVNAPVLNWMHKNPMGRIELAVGVAYGSDTRQVHDILLAVAGDHAEVMRYPEAYVWFTDFGDSALMFELRCFTPRADNRAKVASDLRFALDLAFREAGIEIPFPQRDVHLRETPTGAPAAPAARAAGPVPGSAGTDADE